MAGGRAHWDSVYAAKAEDAVSWFEADAPERLALIERHVPDRGAALVDVGSGLTRLVPALLATGYRDVTGLDISAEAVRLAAARPGGETVRWIVADVAEWRPERRYRLWHERAVLHFLTGEAERGGYARALREGTEPGSVAILSAFALDGPERCSGLPVRRYGRADFEEFLGTDWAALEAFRSIHVTPSGSEQRFETVVARRTG